MTSAATNTFRPADVWFRDFKSGLVVFLVALPLCLGIALASGAPLPSGLISGIIGGLVVGMISGSHTSVSGPAAGLTAIVAAQITALGSFDTFLLAVIIGGALQVVLACVRGGALAAFVPSSVINGLLAAIGTILILKQIPHLLGHDTSPAGEMSFVQPDHKNTFSEFLTIFQGEVHLGAIVIGLLSLLLLFSWGRVKSLRESIVPAPLLVVMLGVIVNHFFKGLGGPWTVESSHLVQVPIMNSTADLHTFFDMPNWKALVNPAVYLSGFTIALVASLETLLNLEAVDKLDTKKRTSPPNRELIAQGVGNMCCGILGGLPLTSVVVRSSVNIQAGGQTKMATIIHGGLLLACVMMMPRLLNMIPLSALAAILIHTGLKLASPKLFKQMWHGGKYQFAPFLITLVSIVFTDLLIGILIGICVSVAFILNSNLRRPVKKVREKHVGGEVLRIELPSQVSFLNRASIEMELKKVPRGTHLLLDGSRCDFIDPDVLTFLKEFRDETGDALGVEVSFQGFRQKFGLKDDTRYEEYTTREIQQLLTPDDVLEILKEGNQRFCSDQRLTRNVERQLSATGGGQFPFAVILSCIDSRAPVETIFDLGLGDVFVARVAGNITSPRVLGSIEYACAVAGAKLIVVLGHTKCGAVTATVDFQLNQTDVTSATGCQHLSSIVDEIRHSVQAEGHSKRFSSPEEKSAFVEEVSRRNVRHSVERIVRDSDTLGKLISKGRVGVIGATYDVVTGETTFDPSSAHGVTYVETKEQVAVS